MHDRIDISKYDYKYTKNAPRLLQVWTIVGGELVSCSKISLQDDRANSYVEESEDNRVDKEKEEKEDKKDENGRVEDNRCEEGNVCYENEQESKQMRGMDEDDRKKLRETARSEKRDSENAEASTRSKLGGRWSKMDMKGKESTDRRSRSESDLLSDLSRSTWYCLAKLNKLIQNTNSSMVW